jgi:hypothetical protein
MFWIRSSRSTCKCQCPLSHQLQADTNSHRIIGEHASQKSADFASAVVFAHEYGILATSLQDRPFIPKSYVALGGVADRCQSAFRKWNPRTHHAPFVFSLDVVLEALRSPEENE